MGFNIFFSFSIVALRKRKCELQLQKCNNEENNYSNASNEQKNSKESNNSSEAVSMSEQKDFMESKKSSKAVPTQKKSRAKTEKRPPNRIRYSDEVHSLEIGDDRVRCKMEGCRYKSTVKCVICSVR